MKKTNRKRLNSYQPREAVSERFIVNLKDVFKCKTKVKPVEIRVTEKKVNAINHDNVEMMT